MKGEWVDIEGDTRTVGIGGKNFFTGEYKGPVSETYSVSNTRDQGQWERFWREGVGTEPPGPLPDGACAILLGENLPKAPTAFEIDSLKRCKNKDEIDVAWKHVWLETPGETLPNARYAVLILPAWGNQTTRTVIAHQEKENRAAELAQTVREITEGTRDKVNIGPVLRLKPRFGFLKIFTS